MHSYFYATITQISVFKFFVSAWVICEGAVSLWVSLSIIDQYLISNVIKKTKTMIISIKLTRKYKLCNLTQNILLSFFSTVTAVNLFSREPTDKGKNIVRFRLKHFVEHWIGVGSNSPFKWTYFWDMMK